MCWTPLCANIQTYTTNVNKTYALLQITGSKDEPNIACIGFRNGHHNTELRMQRHIIGQDEKLKR